LFDRPKPKVGCSANGRRTTTTTTRHGVTDMISNVFIWNSYTVKILM